MFSNPPFHPHQPPCLQQSSPETSQPSEAIGRSANPAQGNRPSGAYDAMLDTVVSVPGAETFVLNSGQDLSCSVAQNPFTGGLELHPGCQPSSEAKKAVRQDLCGSPVSWTNLETGEIRTGNFHCRVRSCKICQRYKQRKAVRELRKWARKLILDPDLRFLLLSISLKNTSVSSVGMLIRLINTGFKRLEHRSQQWPGLGCITSKEFTIATAGTINIHTHSLVAVPAAYFGSEASKAYLTHQEWFQLVQDAFKLDYAPSVDVRRLKGRSRQELGKNLLRTFSYLLKPLDYSDADVGPTLAQQLKNTRRITFSGIFRQARRDYLQQKSRQNQQPANP
jgi:plasmid rolling circle replication initiator protein Rep